MILAVAFANPRACNIFGFRERMRIEAERNDKGILYVKAQKTGAAMMVKENGGPDVYPLYVLSRPGDFHKIARIAKTRSARGAIMQPYQPTRGKQNAGKD